MITFLDPTGHTQFSITEEEVIENIARLATFASHVQGSRFAKKYAKVLEEMEQDFADEDWSN